MWTAASLPLAQEASWDRRYPWLMVGLGLALVALSVWYALQRKANGQDDEPDGPP